MTVASSTNKVQYNCNGSVTAFTFSFRIFETGDIKVILLNTLTGVETTLAETTDYTVSASGNDFTSGGTVTTVQTYSSSYSLTIKRELDLTQETDYREGDSFPAETHENALDRLTMICQQFKEMFLRCLTVPETELVISYILPAILSRKGKVLSFDEDTGAPIAEFTLTDLQSAQDYAAEAAASALISSASASESAVSAGQALSYASSAETAKDDAVIAKNAAETAAGQCTNASNLTSGTVDGDRLPAMSETKKGAVPATGASPDGTKYLADDGTFKTVSGSSGGIAFKNLLRNSLMRIAQRGASFSSVASNAYTLDGWVYQKSGDMVHTVSRDTDVPTFAQAGITGQYSLKLDCTTADTSIAATDYSFISQRVEGYLIAPYVGDTLCLSFWVKATKTGIYCVRIANSAGDRTYVREFTVNSADAWERKEVTFPLDYSGGTWNYTTGIGVFLQFMLACGSNSQGNKDTWNTSNVLATSSQVNACDSTDNNFWLFAPQLELGEAGTDIEVLPPDIDLARNRAYLPAFGGSIAYETVSNGLCTTTTRAQILIRHEPLRSPVSSVTYSNVGHWAIQVGSGTVIAATAIALMTQGGLSVTKLQVDVASGLTAGNLGVLLANNSTDARLYPSCEL